MIKLKASAGMLLVSWFVFGCSTNATSSRTISNTSSIAIKTSSSSSIIKDKETMFATLYQQYKMRDGTQDATDDAQAGLRNVKIIYAGRGNTIIPAFDAPPKNCKLDAVDGMGDVIYGDYHMKYRKLMRAYSADYNAVMKKYCE